MQNIAIYQASKIKIKHQKMVLVWLRHRTLLWVAHNAFQDLLVGRARLGGVLLTCENAYSGV